MMSDVAVAHPSHRQNYRRKYKYLTSGFWALEVAVNELFHRTKE